MSTPPSVEAQRSICWTGTRAFLIECADLTEVVNLHAHLAAHPLPGQRELLAAGRTVMVAFDSRKYAVSGAQAVASLDYDDAASVSGDTIRIPVLYDGEDLAAVANLTNMSVEGVIAAHTQTQWRGAFGGFAPGFTYLVSDSDPLVVPRRETPRTAVPAGSVALAGNFSAVYPRQSPGGWQLIGRTSAQMWDLDRDKPALVRPGDTVVYEAVRELIEINGVSAENTPDGSGGGSGESPASLEVIHPGLQSLIQDLGRPGLGDLGVSASGAADKTSVRQANRILGNDSNAAVIENVLGELELRALGELILAVTGAEVSIEIERVTEIEQPAEPEQPSEPKELEESDEDIDTGPQFHVQQRTAPMRSAFKLHDGETLRLGAPRAGLRTYVGVRGGFDAPKFLNSRATDSMSGIGPSPLATGHVLNVGSPARAGGVVQAVVGQAEPAIADLPQAGKLTELRITLGPRDDWFDAAGIAALTEQEWLATSQSNRIGVRFELSDGSRPMTRAKDGELASEGAVPGSLQIPPSGLPVLFLADHPVTGGYPVAGVVIESDLALAAQLPPGARVKFTPVDPDSLTPLSPSTTSPSTPSLKGPSA
ncbi:KipI family sensor histidine kinase inhibitor [Neomicrococcus aestuarii]|uniref:KipI family sensor histidine kinase inhibitor n=1 Tax=Neomicrococcus aestuarii TaxID=556325 RepID=A0A7W8TVI2_9MICC|nr:carboxyltransferase domain-containing protein [Neomicrococcus aestuarii]MBB5512875.1 KipI family sensor histidine kinase inhibitor [Neomicrococcus aestuarii]